MDAEAALRKIFAKLDELSSRVDKLDTNGKLDRLSEAMAVVSANSRLVVDTVQAHGRAIAYMQKNNEKIKLKCPLIKKDTEEMELDVAKCAEGSGG